MTGFVLVCVCFGLILVEFVLHLFSDTAALAVDEAPTSKVDSDERTPLLGGNSRDKQPPLDNRASGEKPKVGAFIFLRYEIYMEYHSMAI